MSVLFYLVGPWVIDLLTTSADIRTEAQQYLWWAILIPITGVLAFQMDGVYIGSTWSRDMSILMLISLVIYIATFFITKGLWGNDALWFALHVFLVARGLSLAARLPTNTRRAFAGAAS